MKSRLAVSFGEVADREMRHSSEGVSGHLGASRKEAYGVRGTRVLGRKFFRAFLSRLTLGHGPVEVIGLGRLVRGTEPGPMVPTNIFFIIKLWGNYVEVHYCTKKKENRIQITHVTLKFMHLNVA